MKRTVVFAALLGAAALPASAEAVLPTITMQSAGFDPPSFNAVAGDGAQFKFRNEDGNIHTATPVDGGFGRVALSTAAEEAQVEVKNAGRFEYYCEIHANMRGVINVGPSGFADDKFPLIDARPGFADQSKGQFEIGKAAVAVSPEALLTQPDDDADDISRVEVQITGGAHSADVLAFVDGGGIAGAFDPPAKKLTLTPAAGATADEAVFQAALRAVTFAADSSTATRRVTFQAFDGGATPAEQTPGPPDFREITVTVPSVADSGKPAPSSASGGGGTPAAPALPVAARPGGLPVGLPAVSGTAPLLLVVPKRTLTVDAKGRVTVSFQTTPNAVGTAEIVRDGATARTAQKGRRTVLGRGSFRANRAGKATARVTLTRAARRTLRRKRRLSAKLVIRSAGRTASGPLGVRAR